MKQRKALIILSSFPYKYFKGNKSLIKSSYLRSNSSFLLPYLRWIHTILLFFNKTVKTFGFIRIFPYHAMGVWRRYLLSSLPSTDYSKHITQLLHRFHDYSHDLRPHHHAGNIDYRAKAPLVPVAWLTNENLTFACNIPQFISWWSKILWWEVLVKASYLPKLFFRNTWLSLINGSDM